MRFTRITLIALTGLLLALAVPAPDAAGYGLCGYDWAYQGSPMGESYRINANCVDGAAGSAADQIAYIQNGAAAWNGAGACFAFTYGGTTSGTSVTYNNINLVYFDTTPPDGGGYIAATYIWSSGGNVSENDLVFNDQSYTWSGVGNPTGGEYDIWNIAAHEFGHYLCLDDLYGGGDSTKTMYGYGSPGQTYARTLHSDDIAGIQAIYGACGGCTDDGYEENDSYGGATSITAGTVNGLQICSGDDDYFSFSVAEGSDIQVDIAFAHASGNLSLYLVNPSLTQIDSSVSTTNNESVSASGVSAGTYYAVVIGVSGAENSYSLTLTITGSSNTIHTVLGCVPASGTLPYTLQLWPQMCNDNWFTRRIHGKVNVTLASGVTYYNWRAGATNVSAGNCYNTPFGVNLPNLGSLHGVNTFTIIGTDITAAPYNQPPYSPSGDTDSDFCTTTGS
jgi:hypothetical protein